MKSLNLKLLIFTLYILIGSSLFAQQTKMNVDELKKQDGFDTANLKAKKLKLLPNLIAREALKKEGFSNKRLANSNRVVKTKKYPHANGKIIFDNDQDEMVVLDTRQNVPATINGTVIVILKNSLSRADVMNLANQYGFNLVNYSNLSKIVVLKVKTGTDLEVALTNLKSHSQVTSAELDVVKGLIRGQ